MTESVQWETIDCPVCSSKNYRKWRTVRDRFDVIPGQEFTIVNCEDCGFRFLNPRPDIESIGIFYEPEGYDPFLSTKDKVSLTDSMYSMVRTFSLWRKRLLIEDFRRSGSLLDVGCGTGEFVRYMQDFQWEVAGVEPAERAREFVASHGIQVTESLGKTPDNQYDVVTLWHVIEHLHDLEGAVKKLAALTKSGGYLVLAMPNMESYDAKRYQENWVALDTPRHLYHFAESDTVKLFSSTPVRLIDTRNLWLDTIYNVLYSEQLYHRWEKKRYRPFFILNAIFGSYVNDWQQSTRQASASVYILQKEGTNA
ncbi:MAG: Ubiquinone biosynthesis O-methyltransferase [Candidatus Marinimicrobia bacterium]|nr:Ubiquinone biosynthesis O-methyltransferase [Candidatus Neomarinimicrobiota bacterium]